MLTGTPIFHCRAEAGRCRTGVLMGQGRRAPLPSSRDKQAATGQSLPDPQDSSRSLCPPPPTLQPNNNPSPASQGVSSRILHRNSGQKRARDTSTNTSSSLQPQRTCWNKGSGPGNSPRGRCPQARHPCPGVGQELHARITCTAVDEAPKAKRGVSYRPAMSQALFRGRQYTRRLE